MIRTQIQVEKYQMKWLKAYALGKGISMSQLVRESIDFYRTQVDRSERLRQKKKNALRAVGRFASNPEPKKIR